MPSQNERVMSLNEQAKDLFSEIAIWLDNARMLKIYARMAHVIIDAGLDPTDLDNAGGAYLDISDEVYKSFATGRTKEINKLGDIFVRIVLRAGVYDRIMDKPSEYLEVMSKCVKINEERKKEAT